jgi:adenine-specific DNA-methyltransferase
LANYHVWETLCKWDNPEVYGKVNKRTDVKSRKSRWNSKRFCHQEFEQLTSKISAPKVLVSFNNEGYLEKEFLETTLKKYYHSVEVVKVDYKRYVGAQIGVYNQKSKKVGTVKSLKNKEYLFLATR